MQCLRPPARSELFGELRIQVVAAGVKKALPSITERIATLAAMGGPEDCECIERCPISPASGRDCLTIHSAAVRILNRTADPRTVFLVKIHGFRVSFMGRIFMYYLRVVFPGSAYNG